MILFTSSCLAASVITPRLARSFTCWIRISWSWVSAAGDSLGGRESWAGGGCLGRGTGESGWLPDWSIPSFHQGWDGSKSLLSHRLSRWFQTISPLIIPRYSLSPSSCATALASPSSGCYVCYPPRNLPLPPLVPVVPDDLAPYHPQVFPVAQFVCHRACLPFIRLLRMLPTAQPPRRTACPGGSRRSRPLSSPGIPCRPVRVPPRLPPLHPVATYATHRAISP